MQSPDCNALQPVDGCMGQVKSRILVKRTFGSYVAHISARTLMYSINEAKLPFTLKQKPSCSVNEVAEFDSLNCGVI